MKAKSKPRQIAELEEQAAQLRREISLCDDTNYDELLEALKKVQMELAQLKQPQACPIMWSWSPSGYHCNS